MCQEVFFLYVPLSETGRRGGVVLFVNISVYLPVPSRVLLGNTGMDLGLQTCPSKFCCMRGSTERHLYVPRSVTCVYIGLAPVCT